MMMSSSTKKEKMVKIDFEELIKDYRFKDSQKLFNYLREVWKDLSKRSEDEALGVNAHTFFIFYSLPGLISERVFSVLDTDQDDYLNIDEFSEGIVKLFTSSYEELVDLIFNIYDFDKDGLISRNDIKVVFSYIPLNTKNTIVSSIESMNFKYENGDYSCRVESQEEIENYLNKMFGDEEKINAPQFREIIEEKSSEAFLFLIIFIMEQKPFTSKSILETKAQKLVKLDSSVDVNQTTKKNFPKTPNLYSKNLIVSPSMNSRFSPSVSIRESPVMKNRSKPWLTRHNSHADKELKQHQSVEVNQTIQNLVNKNASAKNEKEKKKNLLDQYRKKSVIYEKAEIIQDKNKLLALNGNSGSSEETSEIDEKRAKGIVAKVNSMKNFISNETQIEKVQLSKFKDKKCHSDLSEIEPEKIEDDNISVRSPAKIEKRDVRMGLKSLVSKEFEQDNRDKDSYISPLRKGFSVNKFREGEEFSASAFKQSMNSQYAYKYSSPISVNIIEFGDASESSDVNTSFAKKESVTIYESYLYRINKKDKFVKYWYKLINKDLYCYEKKDDREYKAVKNLSGIYVKKEENFNFKGVTYFCFNLYYPNDVKTYMCDSKEALESWIRNINQVTGFEELHETYEVKQTLGEGYYGIVKLCVQKTTKREAAIKIIPKRDMTTKDMQQVRTEIEILKICQHPNIVSLYDLYENDEYIYIIMEYCRGSDLFDYLHERDFQIQEEHAARLIHQLSSAISFLHSYGIVHRDLKPENILMTNNTDTAEVKILDFGLSKILGPNEKCTETLGTLNYVAPEILKQKPYDKRIDYWSLGIISYVMVCGCLPFNDEKPQDEIMRIIVEDPITYPNKLWKHKSIEAKSYVINLLQKEPEDRLDINKLLQHCWFDKFKFSQPK